MTSDTLILDLDGFEGPLDLLLELARRQKVDLARISILALTEQYLAFIQEARAARLELAADYLVMAAWLAYLKSRLLLPQAPQDEEPNAADLAVALALRLKRLEAMREAARLLQERPQLGRDVFAKGAWEDVQETTITRCEASLYDLLSAYAAQRQIHMASRVTLVRRTVWSLAEARQALERLSGLTQNWSLLDDYLAEWLAEPELRTTVKASTFVATLEMAREGRIMLRQDEAFAPLLIRATG